MANFRFLFVDDDAPILLALERTARRYRNEVETIFACGGGAALSALAQGTFDAVVSDMRMPKTDGTVVLAAARASQPAALRIVLSGQADRDAALRSAASAQQFMSKPSGPDAIREVLRRVSSLRSRLPDPALRALVGGIGQLPLLPRVHGELVVALANPDVSARHLARIILGDAGLCAKVLQLANGGFFGHTRPFHVVEDAVAQLGVEILGSIVAGMPIETDPAAENLQLEANAAARAAAEAASPAQAAQLYTVGLLSNLGRRIVGIAADETTASVVGAYLLEAWGIPSAIVEAVAAGNAEAAAC